MNSSSILDRSTKMIKLKLKEKVGGIVVFYSEDLVKMGDFKQNIVLREFLTKNDPRLCGYWKIELNDGKNYLVKGFIDDYDRLVDIFFKRTT